jgi:hypothetical protein
MSVTAKFIVNVLVTHKRYGAGDLVAMSEASYNAYQQKPEWARLVRLQYVDLPNGDRQLADPSNGELTDTIVKKELVQRENTVRSTVKRIVRDERLTKADEDRFIARALGAQEAFLKDPLKFIRDAESAPKKNRMGAGPALAR